MQLVILHTGISIRGKILYPKNIIKFLPKHPKISAKTINLSQNSTKFARISGNYLYLWFFFLPVLVQNYQITGSVSLDPKISNWQNLLTQKYRIDIPVCLISKCSPWALWKVKDMKTFNFYFTLHTMAIYVRRIFLHLHI